MLVMAKVLFKVKKMSEVKKVGNKYQVYDHIVNITRKFKKKAEADEFAESLKIASGGTEDNQTNDSIQTNAS